MKPRLRHSAHDGGVLSAVLRVRHGLRWGTRRVELSRGVLSVRPADAAPRSRSPPLLAVRAAECAGGVCMSRSRRAVWLASPAGRPVVTLVFPKGTEGDSLRARWASSLREAHSCRLEVFYLVDRRGSQREDGLIGKGHYADVFRAVDRLSGELVAVKAVAKRLPGRRCAQAPSTTAVAVATALAVDTPTVVRRNNAAGGADGHPGSTTSLAFAGGKPAAAASSPRNGVRDSLRMRDKLAIQDKETARTAPSPKEKRGRATVAAAAGRQRATAAHIAREAEIMRTVTHRNVVRCIDQFETTDMLYIVMELAPHGTLSDVMDAANTTMSEDDARAVISQVLSAVAYLHSVGVVHRDVKPENVLVAADGTLKLTDFGLSRFVRDTYDTSDYTLTSVLGTPSFCAPEVVRKMPYGIPVDCWSIGVILHVALTGRFPFRAKTSEDVFQALSTRTRVPFPRSRWACVSPAARDLVRGLLSFNPDHRLTASEALSHPWLGGASSMSAVTRAPTPPFLPHLPLASRSAGSHGFPDAAPSAGFVPARTPVGLLRPLSGPRAFRTNSHNIPTSASFSPSVLNSGAGSRGTAASGASLGVEDGPNSGARGSFPHSRSHNDTPTAHQLQSRGFVRPMEDVNPSGGHHIVSRSSPCTQRHSSASATSAYNRFQQPRDSQPVINEGGLQFSNGASNPCGSMSHVSPGEFEMSMVMMQRHFEVFDDRSDPALGIEMCESSPDLSAPIATSLGIKNVSSHSLMSPSPTSSSPCRSFAGNAYLEGLPVPRAMPSVYSEADERPQSPRTTSSSVTDALSFATSSYPMEPSLAPCPPLTPRPRSPHPQPRSPPSPEHGARSSLRRGALRVHSFRRAQGGSLRALAMYRSSARVPVT